MSRNCPRCGQAFDESESDGLQFCQSCGAPAADTVDGQDAERLDRRLRLLMIGFGALWLFLFFIPFGSRGNGSPVFSWELLENREGMAHLVAWPLVFALIYLVLGLVRPLPAWLRHGAALLLGISGLGVLFGTELSGYFAQDIGFLLAGGVAWVWMFLAVGVGLLQRVRAPRSIGAKVWLGLGLLLGLIAYLASAMGESTLVGALLYQLGQGGASMGITRVLMLLPMFVLLVACVGFRAPEASGDPVRIWSKVVGLGMLIYLPALMVLFGLLLSAAHDTVWFFVMFLKLAIYVAGFFACLVPANAWMTDFVAHRLLPALKDKTST
jgi:hypothetical protein